MYLLLAALGSIIFIHSILLIFVIQKNAEIAGRLDQIDRRRPSSKLNRQAVSSKKK
ncbi:hypothetical protein [Candidatus Enterococcus lemimoniae]|uniref:Uncharacterized protein n=1 Tax=Candidatus Enterococcus lemimoniae TaxID=1834167 RepID=A0ABZ2T8M6_9ENTE|nr:hypothetical protein [Enterococcus sp. 12C11_DIV0727]OTO70374.1 hypothetical protein A5866_002596 [Enterococcus sp. 12C11_DIV0727]